jgi:phosphoribosyl 1,2-cyclic phosphodiesterase
MKIQSINSSSAGCCYIIDSGNERLLIDAGIPLSKIRRALNYDLSNVVGCLVSHEHGDHAKYLPQLSRETAVKIYCTDGTQKAFSLPGTCQIITGNEFLTISPEFSAKTVYLTHDENIECLGFVILAGPDVLFYATDTGEINFKIPGLTKAMIECNHSFEKLVDSGLNKAAVKRICETHLSVSQVCEFVSRHPDLTEIHLLHLSSGHSDAKLFKEMVQDVSGALVYVAGE